MIKENYNVIGVMSGTSLDGIDLAHVYFKSKDGKWSFEIIESETIPYPDAWLVKLKNAIHYDAKALETLNQEYTSFIGSIIKDFIQRYNLEELDAVCSHGHTILHDPGKGYTLQIGNLPELAALVGQKIVCDFRVEDVALGGQGAPLVPIGDRILFSDFDYCLNLGGFSNISFEENGQRIAFDISPVNTVLNHFANLLGLEYDDRGAIAASGTIHDALLTALNALPFYKKNHPKSLGLEFVKETVLPLINSYELKESDGMATFTEHIALQIAAILNKKEGTLLATGGGVYNDFLMERMQHHLPGIRIVIPDAKILEYKEALIFALLGILKLRGDINVLSSVTGAKHDHSAGIIHNSK